MKFLTLPEHISEGDENYNFFFTASLFLAKNGLELAKDVEVPDFVVEPPPPIPREERAFMNFINGIGAGVTVRNLYPDLVDGLVLLKVLDRIVPGCVDWKKRAETKKLD